MPFGTPAEELKYRIDVIEAADRIQNISWGHDIQPLLTFATSHDLMTAEVREAFGTVERQLPYRLTWSAVIDLEHAVQKAASEKGIA